MLVYYCQEKSLFCNLHNLFSQILKAISHFSMKNMFLTSKLFFPRNDFYNLGKKMFNGFK